MAITTGIIIDEVAQHRNGMCGAPFHVIKFVYKQSGEGARNMVGIVFDEPGHVAVFDRNALGRGEIAFGGDTDGRNSWRGDEFESALRAAIREEENRQ